MPSQTIGLGRDNGNGASLIQLGADPIDVKGLVGKQRIEVDAGDQRRHADAVVTLTREQDEAREVAQRIDQRHDLARATILVVNPPLDRPMA